MMKMGVVSGISFPLRSYGVNGTAKTLKENHKTMYDHACIAQVFLYMHIGNNNIYILISHYSHPTASPLTDCIAKLSCTLRIFIITFRFTSDLKK